MIGKNDTMSKRVETGPMKFENDWTGIFIRGDEALHMSFVIAQMVEDIDKGVCPNPIMVMYLKQHADLLGSCKE